MSAFTVLHDTTLELRRQVFTALAATAATDFAIDDESRITLSAPGDDVDDSAVASLYLYHVDIDKHLRNQRLLPDPHADDLFHHPPLPLQLRYLFTPVGTDEETNQLLLGRVLQHFHDLPTLTTFGTEMIGDSHGAAGPGLRVRPDPLSLEQLSQLWSALSTPFRVSVSLLIEVVAVDSGRPPTRRRRTETLVTVAGQAPR